VLRSYLKSLRINKTARIQKAGLLLVLILAASGALHAQGGEQPPVAIDSTIIPEEETASDEQQEEQTDFVKLGEVENNWQVHPRTVPDSLLNKFRGDNTYWYSTGEGERGDRQTQPNREVKNGSQQTKEEPRFSPTRQTFADTTWFRTLMWLIIIGGFAGAVGWYLMNNNVTLFRKKQKDLSRPEEDEEMPENIFDIKYPNEIDKAAAQGNYRLAIRLLYLRLLKNFAERNIIQYKQDRTNLDYLMQLSSTRYYPDFFRVTRHYEYAWYGEFAVTGDMYQVIRHQFDQLENKAG